MITAGIDAGASSTKVVVLSDGKIVATNVVTTGFEVDKVAQEALESVLAQAGITRLDIKRIIATGAGGKSVSIADDYMSDVTCDARGAVWLMPSVRTVIDIGAESSRSLKCDESGKVLDFSRNDKCASGVGSFIEAMARALETPIEDIGPLSEQSDVEIPMNLTCVIFAESEVVSLIHAKTPKADIARSIHDATASRTFSMLRRVGVQQDVVVIGGGARNVGLVSALKRRLGADLLVPADPETVGALGAAVFAAS